MLYAYVQRFDTTENFEIFWEILVTKQSLNTLIMWASLGLMRVGLGGRSALAMQAPGPGASVRLGYKIN